MPLLYYWRPDIYARDRAFGFSYHLNQNSIAMTKVRAGDSLWAFTRSKNGLYVLAAELIVRAVTQNPPNYRYGRYRTWGDLGQSRYYETESGVGADLIIRSLDISAQSAALGQSFQGHAAVRVISIADHQLLAAFAAKLPVLEKVAFDPEEELETRIVHGAATVREAFGPGYQTNQRMEYLSRTLSPQRLRRHVEDLQRLYNGRCQLCGYDPQLAYGHLLCQGHHVQWLSRGGEDALENMLLVCPNHHVAIHRDDAPFDYANLAYTFSTGHSEPVRLNQHLQRSV